MPMLLYIASTLVFLIGIAHSVLGERFILVRLFRKNNLPHLYGSQWFTKQTLRFAWHITTLAWWGFAAILVHIASNDVIEKEFVLWVIAIVFSISGIVSLIYSKGKHFSWLVFFVIAVLTLISL